MEVSSLRLFATLALLAMLPLAGAVGEHDVRGRWVATGLTTLEGRADVSAAIGTFDLEPAVRADEPFLLTWARAHAYVVSRNSSEMAAHSTNHTFALGEGGLTRLHCGAACVAVLFAPDPDTGRVHYRGGASGALLPRTTPWTTSLGNAHGQQDAFLHTVPVGSFAFGPEGLRMQDARAGAEGTLVLVLYDGTIDVRTARGEQTLRFQRTESPTFVVAGQPVGKTFTSSFAVVTFEGARFETREGTAITLQTPVPDVRVEGTLGVSRALGELRVDGKRYAVADTSVLLDGSLSLRPIPHSETLSTDALSSRVPGMEGGGRASRVVIGGTLVLRPEWTAHEATGVSTLLVALAAMLYFARDLVLTPLYSRIKTSHVLSNENRRLLHEAVVRHPGATVSDLARELGIARGVVQHHLRMLEVHAFVTVRRNGWQAAYFPAGLAPSEASLQIDRVLADESRRRVAGAIAASPMPLTQKELAHLCGLSLRLVSYHVAKLEETGLVAAEGALPRRYRPTPPLAERFPEEGAASA